MTAGPLIATIELAIVGLVILAWLDERRRG